MDNLTREESIFRSLKEMITSIIGEDAAEIVGIHRSSRFTKDLEMDSIQILAFAEMVQEAYGQEIDFTLWLSKKSLVKLIGLTVGDVAELIDKGK